MVNLTRIYTRTGDDGTTSLGDFSRTSKNDPRLVAYADLCTPLTLEPPEHPPLRVTQEYIDDLEAACDVHNEALPPLRSFILPGGSAAAAYLHIARTVCRRAERAVWTAVEQYGTDQAGGVNPLTARYLNRLSDLLFILCRVANSTDGDILWQPGGGRATQP